MPLQLSRRQTLHGVLRSLSRPHSPAQLPPNRMPSTKAQLAGAKSGRRGAALKTQLFSQRRFCCNHQLTPQPTYPPTQSQLEGGRPGVAVCVSQSRFCAPQGHPRRRSRLLPPVCAAGLTVGAAPARLGHWCSRALTSPALPAAPATQQHWLIYGLSLPAGTFCACPATSQWTCRPSMALLATRSGSWWTRRRAVRVPPWRWPTAAPRGCRGGRMPSDWK